MSRIICVIGTRPEAIKMAPVVRALEGCGIEALILATAQHRGLLDQMLSVFGLHPSWDLDLMKPNQSLAGLTGALIPALDDIFAREMPDLVIAQGDTSSVFCAALAAYYRQIPFAHVEAGLRSGDLASPFPEEGMRRLAGTLTRLHFPPTEGARVALLNEGFPDSHIHVVGNTVIDALLGVARREDLPWPEGVPFLVPNEKLALVTLHRRENFGDSLSRILGSLRGFALRHPETRLVYPVHPNPNVLGPARSALADLKNVCLVDPLDYPQMVAMIKASYAVFTDSGGLQEEAPALGRPVLVFRQVTERPEAVKAGSVRLVGTDPEAFQKESERLWSDPRHYEEMAQPRFPYGDGTAAPRIASVVQEFLGRGRA